MSITVLCIFCTAQLPPPLESNAAAGGGLCENVRHCINCRCRWIIMRQVPANSFDIAVLAHKLNSVNFPHAVSTDINRNTQRTRNPLDISPDSLPASMLRDIKRAWKSPLRPSSGPAYFLAQPVWQAALTALAGLALGDPERPGQLLPAKLQHIRYP